MRKFCPYLGIAAAVLLFLLIGMGLIGLVISIAAGIGVNEACKRSHR